MGVGDYPHPISPIALGAGDTTVMRMTNAFAIFANQGRALTPTLIDYVQDRRGQRHLARRHPALRRLQRAATGTAGRCRGRRSRTRQVVDPMTAYQVVHMLEGVVQRGTATILRDLDRPLFGKTGTTTGPTNVWFIGGSPQIVAGVYMGFDQPRPMGGYAQGGTLAAPIFRQFARDRVRRHAGGAVPRADRASAWSGSTAARASACSAPGRATDPRAAVIWEAFKPESEPRRTIAPRRDRPQPPRDRGRRAAAPRPTARDSDFLQREGGIY